MSLKISTDHIERLIKCIQGSLKDLNLRKKRIRKLNFNHLFFVRFIMTSNKMSYQTATSKLIEKTDINVSYQGVFDACKSYGHEYVEEIIANLLKLFPTNKRRFLAVDASWLATNKAILERDPGHITTNTGSYALPLLTGIYDIESRVPVKLLLTKEHCERSAFLQCLDHTRPGDCLTFDRGYPSEIIISQLRFCCKTSNG